MTKKTVFDDYDKKILPQEANEENKMIDNLSWVLNFMRKFERKNEDSRIRRALDRFYTR